MGLRQEALRSLLPSAFIAARLLLRIRQATSDLSLFLSIPCVTVLEKTHRATPLASRAVFLLVGLVYWSDWSDLLN